MCQESNCFTHYHFFFHLHLPELYQMGNNTIHISVSLVSGDQGLKCDAVQVATNIIFWDCKIFELLIFLGLWRFSYPLKFHTYSWLTTHLNIWLQSTKMEWKHQVIPYYTAADLHCHQSIHGLVHCCMYYMGKFQQQVWFLSVNSVNIKLCIKLNRDNWCLLLSRVY